MSEQNKPFVITDRRKFTAEGELRPDAEISPAKEERESKPVEPVAAVESKPAEAQDDLEIPAGPTAEQTEQAKRAYDMTADRLDTAVRAANPGMDHPPAMSFDQLVQSVYLTTMMQLGGTTQEGQPPQVDILGARQSIDMLAVLEEKTKGNLAADETRLLESALFELRMVFLEITQAMARQAASKGQGAPGGPGGGAGKPGPVGPSIVR